MDSAGLVQEGFLDGVEVFGEVVVGEPVEIEDGIEDGGVTVGSLDAFCLVGERLFFGLPGFVFGKASFFVDESELADVFVAPAEWEVWDEVVVVDEAVVWEGIEVAELSIARSRRAVGVDGLDVESFVFESDGGECGHCAAEAVPGEPEGFRAAASFEESGDVGPDVVDGVGESAVDSARIWRAREEECIGVGEAVADVLCAAEGDDGGGVEVGEEAVELAGGEEGDFVGEAEAVDPVAGFVVGATAGAGEEVAGIGAEAVSVQIGVNDVFHDVFPVQARGDRLSLDEARNGGVP